MKIQLIGALLLCGALPASARVASRSVLYSQGGQALEGTFFHDTRFTGKRPGVVIFHQWRGPGVYEKRRARMLAEMGYTAFVADIYGRGVRPKDAKEAGAQAGRYRNNRPLLRERARAAVVAMRAQREVNSGKLAAMGYCFGGGTALELARSGADLRGFASFHGNLDTPDASLARNIKGSVLVMHGAVDPLVSPEAVRDFQSEMAGAKVDFEFVAYGNAVHSFTEREAGSDPSDGVAYNERANKRSWAKLSDFLREIFA